ncbi:Programmed cell death protein 6 [Golovinomyces cichoracearum]|uniref:Programmed cell death protein 6 n=1 Tax=Golovinomyces cichoracearum TaxID=62708 RepID=A0A420IXJ3_9PEZI|nr:Programmed cell death protein 6 [Golovinomyces cichoracearum]
MAYNKSFNPDKLPVYSNSIDKVQADLPGHVNKPIPTLPQRRVVEDRPTSSTANYRGQLSERELSQALVNGDWSPFDPLTIKTMIRLFDTNNTKTINFEEFCGLWEFLGSWRTLFDHFDADGSGDINIDEYTNAFIAFGYRLSNPFVRSLFRKYDKRCEGAISFDLFVQSCICLKRMTNIFKRYDQDRDGYITLSL